mgnify:CR=1
LTLPSDELTPPSNKSSVESGSNALGEIRMGNGLPEIGTPLPTRFDPRSDPPSFSTWSLNLPARGSTIE